MANFFKEYKDACKQKHANEVVAEDLNLITPKNTGATVPNPKTLKNKKRPMGKFVKSDSEDE